MKERPILFKGEMVRAILDGHKTQTRRVVKPQSAILTDELARGLGVQPPAAQNPPVIPCPHGTPGDRLWVRETWAHERDGTGCPDDTGVLYRATDPGWDDEGTGLRWRPSIFMPRWASRILLEITDVRVQRLMEISEEDARAEGIDLQGFRSLTEGIAGREHRIKFHDLWEDIHGDGSWNTNPWVWAITFRRLEP
jgi:hypothetical protein